MMPCLIRFSHAWTNEFNDLFWRYRPFPLVVRIQCCSGESIISLLVHSNEIFFATLVTIFLYYSKHHDYNYVDEQYSRARGALENLLSSSCILSHQEVWFIFSSQYSFIKIALPAHPKRSTNNALVLITMREYTLLVEWLT